MRECRALACGSYTQQSIRACCCVPAAQEVPVGLRDPYGALPEFKELTIMSLRIWRQQQMQKDPA